MRINFGLKLFSTQKSPVRILLDDNSFDLLDADTIEIKKELDISPDDSAEQYPILEIQNLQEGIDAKLEIDSFCINSIDVGPEEMQDFFSLSVEGNKYADDGLIEKVSEICFNGKLNLMVGKNIRKFFWSPFYSSRKRNDFVYDNRLACLAEGTDHYPTIDERLGEKVYTNLPHKDIDRNNDFKLGCFGCSITFGTGLDYKEAWPSLLTHDHLNFSLPSLGIDGIYLNLVNSLKKFEWKTTVIVLPNWERKILRFHLPSGEVTRVPTTLTHEWAQGHFTHWAWKTFNRQLSEDDRRRWKKIYQKNFRSLVDGKVERYSKKVLTKIVKLCENHDRPLYLTSWSEDTYDSLESFVESDRILPFFEKIDEARDMVHPGPNSHKKWADQTKSILFG